MTMQNYVEFIGALIVISVILSVTLIVIGYAYPEPKPPPPKPEVKSVPLFDETYKRITLTFPSDDIKPSLFTELINAISYISTNVILEVNASKSNIHLAIIC